MSSVTTQKQEHSPRYLQGEQEGQAEAHEMLREAVQQKGTTLTVTEIRNLYGERFQSHLGTRDQSVQVDEWFAGWCGGFVGVCLDEERNAPDPDGLWSPWRAATSVSLGTIVLLLDSPQFVRGMEYGLEHCFSTPVSGRVVSAQELGRFLIETMLEEGQEHEPASDEFRAGLSFGWIMGRFHPDLLNTDEHLSWVQALAMQYSGTCSAL